MRSNSTSAAAPIVMSDGLRPASPSATPSTPAVIATTSCTMVNHRITRAPHPRGEVDQHACPAVDDRHQPGQTTVRGDGGHHRSVRHRQGDAFAVQEVGDGVGIEVSRPGRARRRRMPACAERSAAVWIQSHAHPRPRTGRCSCDAGRSGARRRRARRPDRGRALGCTCPMCSRPRRRDRRQVAVASIKHIEPRDRDRAGRELDLLPGARQGVGTLAVDLDGAEGARDLLDVAGERGDRGGRSGTRSCRVASV